MRRPGPSTARRAPRVPPRWVIRSIWLLHRAAHRVTRGRFGLRTAAGDRAGMMKLTTVGRRTRTERMCILGYLEDGPNLFTLAMNGWGKSEPAWWLNLQAQPDASVDLPRGTQAVRARAANEDERAAPMVEVRRWPLGKHRCIGHSTIPQNSGRDLRAARLTRPPAGQKRDRPLEVGGLRDRGVRLSGRSWRERPSVPLRRRTRRSRRR